jgi:hypothetical protein
MRSVGNIRDPAVAVFMTAISFHAGRPMLAHRNAHMQFDAALFGKNRVGSAQQDPAGS